MQEIFQRLKPIHYIKVDIYVLTPCSPSCRITSNVASSLGDLAFWSGENLQMWPTKVVKKWCEISCFDPSPKNSFNFTISWFKGVYQTKVLSGLVSKAALIFFIVVLTSAVRSRFPRQSIFPYSVYELSKFDAAYLPASWHTWEGLLWTLKIEVFSGIPRDSCRFLVDAEPK